MNFSHVQTTEKKKLPNRIDKDLWIFLRPFSGHMWMEGLEFFSLSFLQDWTNSLVMQWLRDEGKIVLRDWWSLDTSRKTIKRSLEIWCCWGSRGIDLLLVSSLKIQFVTSSSWREVKQAADLKFYPIISNPRKFTTGFLAFLRPVSHHHPQQQQQLWRAL